mgnify:CR=1 FL=1
MISYGKQHLVKMNYISFDISWESHHRNVQELSDQVISHEHPHIAGDAQRLSASLGLGFPLC